MIADYYLQSNNEGLTKMAVKYLTTIFLCCIFLSQTGDSFGVPESSEDHGEPLFLTPFIEGGRYDEAKNLSRVDPLNGTNITSFTGYLTVNPLYNSNMFFWFIPALNNPENAPVVLWLQGGPGGTSMYSLFEETGPWRITPELKIREANYTWTSVFNVLYIENPVGTGFSFTDSEEGYATNEEDVARDLYNALQQFFTLFSEYQHQEFYVTGESYAGKYITAIAHKVHVENRNASLQINLRGLSIGNGLVDPKTQMKYGDFLFNTGLIDDAQRHLFYEQEQLAIQKIDEGDFMEALRHFDTMIFGAFVVNESYFHNFSGLSDIYNIISTEVPRSDKRYGIYLAMAHIRRYIHVGNRSLDDTDTVTKHLLSDIMNTTKPWLESLLDAGYKVLIYGGTVDACIPYPAIENMIAHLKWNHSDEYTTAKRTIWKVDPIDLDVAGYAKKVHNFQEVAVRNAGHLVPRDKPRATLDMISRFIFDKPF